MGPFRKSLSFNAVGTSSPSWQQQTVANDEQTDEDLQETITALRRSVSTHASANAETLENFTTLKKVHDSLYSEHLSLQEQMDDAVELLKYLKEEKSSNETKIKELSTEIEVLKESASGKVGVGVVSLTIENLTKEKKELEDALKEMEESRQDAINTVERYEIERNELMDRLSEFGMVGAEEEGLTQKLALLYEQASSQKDQIRKLEEQSKQRGSYDAKLQNLLSNMTEEKDRANESIAELQREKDSLLKEREAMKSELKSFQQQEEKMSQLNSKLSDSLSTIAQLKRERNNKIPPAEGDNELLLENESLKYKIQDLQDQLEVCSQTAAQKDELHAQLEKDMQERLANKLAAQLKESKVAMEVQIRKELEKEYQSSSSQLPSLKNKSKSFHGAEACASQSNGQGGVAPVQLEIEKNLRLQLQQVKAERERWTHEQEEFQSKVLLSQQQLSQVRDGYKKKLDREKARVNELEAVVSDRESVIGKLSDEYRRAMDEMDELQMRQSSIKQTLVQQHEEEIEKLRLEIGSLRNGQVDHHDKFNKLKKERDTLKQKYNSKSAELQTTVSQLEQLNLENEEYMRRLEVFDSLDSSTDGMNFEELQAEYNSLCAQHNDLKQKYEGQKEELKTTLQQLETLNEENEEFLNKNVAVEIEIKAEKKCVEELRDKVQSLETANGKLVLDISKSEEERKQLHQSNLETKKLCLETETKLRAALEESDQNQNAIKDLEAKQEALSEEKSKISEELKAEKEKLSSLTNQFEAVAREKEDHLSSIQVLTKETEELRSTIVSSEVAWQDRLDSKVNEVSASHEEAVHEFQEKINTLSLEIDELKKAKSELDGRNKENEDRIQELVEETNKLSAKDSSQIVRIQELEQEKAQLEEDLKSAADEKDTLISTQAKQLEALNSEKEEITSACDTKLALLRKERDELSEKISSLDKIAEKNKLLQQSGLDKQELETKLSALRQSKDDLAKDYESKLIELSCTISDLKQEKIDLSTVIEQMKHIGIGSDQKIEQLNKELERQKEVNSELRNEATTSGTTNESSVNSQVDIGKLQLELNDAQDRCRVLEGGLEDLQLEKEDVEAENEELATKLADLTAQAKTMLVRNEEMENQLDELAMEYDCRVSELERQLLDSQGKLEDKSSRDENGKSPELEVLEKKHDKALETIVNLKKTIDETQQMQKEREADVKRLKEEALELRQVIEHLQSENDAARQIKFIVLDLKTKNMELTELLRKSRQQKRAAAEIIERLKDDNKKLSSNVRKLRDSSSRQLVAYKEKEKDSVEDQIVPINTNSSADDNKKIQDMDAELTRYKSIVDKMMSERSIFAQRLSEMLDLAPLNKSHGDNDGQSKLGKDGNVPMLTFGECSPFVAQGAIVPTQEGSAVPDDARIKSLTDENVDLAQRLGGAVAEKEFAMRTLSKLSSKLEELVERNKLLESIADLKSSYAISEGSVHSRVHSQSNAEKSQAPLHPDEQGRNDRNNSTTSILLPHSIESLHLGVEQSEDHYDANSAFGDSTIVTYDLSIKKLDPEQYVDGSLPADVSVERRKTDTSEGVDGRKDRIIVSGNPTSVYDESTTCSSDQKLIKVPGGEYLGQLNSKGQKHGVGKMKYDNGNEYEGQWKNNKRDGKGTTRYTSGNVYIGMWKGGKRHGFGVFHISKSGDIYRGNWSGGIKSGPGVYEYADGELDVSFYTNDVRVGDGVRWNAERSRASRLFDGKLKGIEGDFPVDDAMRLTKKLGFVV